MFFFLVIIGISLLSLVILLINQIQKRKVTPSADRVVVITGCDSGLGYFTAIECYEKGFTVIALTLNEATAKEFSKKFDTSRFIALWFDLRDEKSIKKVFEAVKIFIESRELTFHALINNAGVMVFGEFEWLTTDAIRNQLEVNLLGPMLLMKYFGAMIRQHRARLINVTSHCSLKALTSLSVYSATKAGLKFWTEALEKELRRFGVAVISILPGK